MMMHGLANPKNGILNLLCILEILLRVKGSEKMNPAVLLISVLFHQPSINPLQSDHFFVKTNCMKTSTVSSTSKHDTV